MNEITHLRNFKGVLKLPLHPSHIKEKPTGVPSPIPHVTNRSAISTPSPLLFLLRNDTQTAVVVFVWMMCQPTRKQHKSHVDVEVKYLHIPY